MFSVVCLHQWLLPFVVLDHVVDFVCMSASRHVQTFSATLLFAALCLLGSSYGRSWHRLSSIIAQLGEQLYFYQQCIVHLTISLMGITPVLDQ